MTSAYFESFLREYRSTGKEKIDGYTYSNFDQMSDDEKEQAFNLLAHELESSSVAVDPLFYLNKEEACRICKERYVDQKRSGHTNFHLAAKMFAFDESENYVKDFEECYEKLGNHNLILYINDAETIDHVKATGILKRIVVECDEAYVRRHAAKALVRKTSIKDEETMNGLVNHSPPTMLFKEKRQ